MHAGQQPAAARMGVAVAIDPEDEQRGQLYRLLARLLAAPPDQALLDVAAGLTGDDTPLGRGLAALAVRAAQATPAAAADEYGDLFIGIGRGELVPYASYYLTGFLNEKPLARLRGEMARLGIARADHVKEPEDHIAALCEMMAGLIDGSFGEPAPLATQRRFFDGHLARLGAAVLRRPRGCAARPRCMRRSARSAKPSWRSRRPRSRCATDDGWSAAHEPHGERERGSRAASDKMAARGQTMASDQDGKAAGRRRFLKLASLGAVAGTVAAAAGARASEAAAADARARRQRLSPDRARQEGLRARPLLSARSRRVVSSQGRAIMLRKKTSGAVNGSRMSKTLAGLTGGVLDRRTFLSRSGLAAGGVAAASLGDAGMVTRADGADPGRGAGAAAGQDGLHPLLGRLHGDRRGRERRLDRPGAGLRQPVQSRRPLRQRSFGARARPRRAPPEVPDEARRRQVPEDLLGAGDRRDRRPAARDPRGQRARRGVLDGRLQAQQRGRLSVPQARRLLGHQQLRQPGADLPFDHGRGCGQHLGLRRDDQQLQRHAQFARDAVHRQQCRRGAPGRDAAHPARQGAEQRAADRLRPALHAHRGPCR